MFSFDIPKILMEYDDITFLFFIGVVTLLALDDDPD